MTNQIQENLEVEDVSIPWQERWITVETIADMLGFKYHYTRQQIVTRDDFPVPAQLAKGGRKLYKAGEVDDWLKSQRPDKPARRR